MVAMDGEDWYSNVDVWVFIVNVIESTVKDIASVTQPLQFTGLLS